MFGSQRPKIAAKVLRAEQTFSEHYENAEILSMRTFQSSAVLKPAMGAECLSSRGKQTIARVDSQWIVAAAPRLQELLVLPRRSGNIPAHLVCSCAPISRLPPIPQRWEIVQKSGGRASWVL